MFAQLLDQLFLGMGHAVDFFKSVEVVSGVSVWMVLCCCIVMSVVITGLINVVRIGFVTSPSNHAARAARDDRISKKYAKKKGGG